MNLPALVDDDEYAMLSGLVNDQDSDEAAAA